MPAATEKSTPREQEILMGKEKRHGKSKGRAWEKLQEPGISVLLS